MIQHIFRELKTVGGVDHVSLEGWIVIIESLLGWVERWFLKDEVPVMANNLFSNWEVLVVSSDVLIVFTPVGNWIINIIASILLWVLVLVASGRRANWVGFQLNKPVFLWEIPGTVNLDSIFHVFEGVGDISIHSEVWYEIVFLNIILTLRPVPMVTKLLLSVFERLIIVSNGNISRSKVWDEIVDIVVWLFVRMLVLTATG